MKNKLLLTVALLLSLAFTRQLRAQSSAFTYQGQLTENGTPTTGLYDFEFTLYDSSGGGGVVGGPITNSPVLASNGLFTVALDFGPGVFDGNGRWLNIGVKTNGGVAFSTLSPRQPITPTPVAHFALAGNAGPQGPAGPPGPAGDSSWTQDANTLYNTAHYVGIGTIPNVSARLDVDGTLAQKAIEAVSSYDAPTIIAKNSGPGPALQLYSVNEATWWYGGAIQIGHMEELNLGIDRNEIIARAGGAASSLYLNHDPSQPTGPVVIGSELEVNGFGRFMTNVGIGLGGSDPTSKLDILAGANEAHAVEAESDHAIFPTIYARNAANGPVLWAESSEDVSLTNITSGTIVAGSPTGPNVAIDNNEIMARDNGASAILHLNADGGEVLVGQNSGGTAILSTPILQITGGADLSEMFDVGGGTPIEPGMLVSIDPKNPGRLIPSTCAYDPKVAGIISGAGGVMPGLRMGQEHTIAAGGHPVALTGRVYCCADATTHGIRPGDLLTTSDTPGHAMKATDRDRTYGTVIGKAMTALEQGERGLVLVLVNLQ